MDLEHAVLEIQKRNARVDADKAWERSGVRRIAVAVLVFCAAYFWLNMQGSEAALRDALFPPVGYLLSTTALSILRVQWEARRHSRKS